jgi:biopolymer transport protein ExbD
MARERKRRKAGCDDIPVTSFSDIAFLLIIFFLLATTLVKTQGFITDFPSGQKSEKPQEKTAAIALRDGKITLNDQEVDVARLRADLKALRLDARQGDAKVVLMEATGKVDYQTYFEVMAAITEAGGTICIIREEGGE